MASLSFSDITQQLYSDKLSTADLVMLTGYAVVCLIIGLWSSKNQNDEDYMIAGRKLGTISFTASVVASYLGGAAIVAYSAYVYKFGVSAFAVFIGTAAGFLIFIPYAKKLRSISQNHRFYTLSDWFYHHYGKATGLLSAIILLIVYFGMLLNQFIAGSSILANISGWSYELALCFSSIVIAIYLFAGGFRSVIKTDVFQYIVLLVLFIIFGFVLTGEKRDMAINVFDFSRIDPAMTIAFIVFGIFIVFQSAEYWQRVYAAKSQKVVNNGLKASAFFTLLTGIAITMIGLAAHDHIPGIEARNAFAQGITLLVPKQYLGAGLILIFAAIMSSADTIIFVLASSLASDYTAHFRKNKPSAHHTMKQTRIFILLLSALGFGFAWFFRDLVAVIVFITGIGFTIIPATIASFHFNLRRDAVYGSFVAGTAYIIMLITFDLMIAELAIASFAISALALIGLQNMPGKIIQSKTYQSLINKIR